MPQQWDYDVFVYSHHREELEKDNGWAISILIAVPILLVLWLINYIIQALFNSDKKEKVENNVYW